MVKKGLVGSVGGYELYVVKEGVHIKGEAPQGQQGKNQDGLEVWVLLKGEEPQEYQEK